MSKNFTDKDKLLAKKHKEAGYNWALRTRYNFLLISKNKPYKLFLVDEWNTGNDSKIISNYYFKPIQPDSEPTRLDDIIGEKK